MPSHPISTTVASLFFLLAGTDSYRSGITSFPSSRSAQTNVGSLQFDSLLSHHYTPPSPVRGKCGRGNGKIFRAGVVRGEMSGN
jgi:hypothetical protein